MTAETFLAFIFWCVGIVHRYPCGRQLDSAMVHYIPHVAADRVYRLIELR